MPVIVTWAHKDSGLIVQKTSFYQLSFYPIIIFIQHNLNTRGIPMKKLISFLISINNPLFFVQVFICSKSSGYL